MTLAASVERQIGFLAQQEQVELTILMPCLNEERTLAECILKAFSSIQALSLNGEVLVADNGSTDGSVDVARKHGASVVHVQEPGYGAALIGGIKQARGKYVIMGDADCSYDFGDLGGFVHELRRGKDFVCGNRFAGGIERGAMPFLHQYLGNPVLSYLGKLFHGSNLGDFHCGLRGFAREKVLGLELQCPGMEFASEMIVKSSRAGLNISEVPTKLYPDKRDRKPHLRTWRDGWRHLRFLLLLAPKWLFFLPGIAMFVIGLLLAMPLFISGGLQLAGVGFGVHTVAYSLCSALIGSMLLQLSLGARKIGANLGLFQLNTLEKYSARCFSPERGLILGGTITLIGVWLAWLSLSAWTDAGFSKMHPESLMRLVLPSVFSILLGVQIIVGSLFNGMLDLYFSYYKKKS